MALIPKNYARLESGYREKALKIYPWVCGRCSREFVYSNLEDAQKDVGVATFNPLADLKAMMNKKN